MGARSTGAAGMVYSLVQDTVPLSSNPALASSLGNRLDLTLEYDRPTVSNFYLHGNPAGGDQKFGNDDQNFLFPYAGFSRQLDHGLAVAMTGFIAGAGAGYEPSPFERFGGDPETSFQLFQVGISTIVAYEVLPDQHLGLSLNLSYDAVEVKGLGQGFAQLSETPEHFSDQGRDGSLGAGISLGWHGQLTPWLAAGAAWRSKTFAAKRIDRYEGLLPDRGRLEFPSFFGGGFALTPIASWTFAVEAQRYDFAKVAAFGNSLAQLPEHAFGANGGPGFGWRSQNVLRTAVLYEARPDLVLRAGYARGTQVASSSDTLLAAFAIGITTNHYTAGATWKPDGKWEWTGSVAWAPATRVNGRNSIPQFAGGGEADVETSALAISIALSRRF